MDPVSRPTDASVQVDGRIVPVGQTSMNVLQIMVDAIKTALTLQVHIDAAAT